MPLTLYVDSDGTPRGTRVLVIGEDDMCLGEIRGVLSVDYHTARHKRASVRLHVADVPGRFLADAVLIKELKLARRPWWRRLMGWCWSPTQTSNLGAKP
jgi:hypothetical protein